MAAKKDVLTGLCAVMVLGLCVLAGAGREETGPKQVATAAYKLRMEGKVDDALAMLKEAASKDPNNAAVQYELARIYYHIALGRPQQLESMMKDSQVCIEKAVENEPENVSYHVFAGGVGFMRGYMFVHVKGDNSAAKEQFGKACKEFESAVRLKSDYREAMLYLVELYAVLPEDAGGNRATAEKYAKQLEGMDKIFGAKAESLLSEKDSAFWKGILESNPVNTEVLEELGKAYLRADKVDEAVSCFEKAIKINPEKAYLFLDLSIYHTFSAMEAQMSGNNELLKTSIASGEAAVTRYLDSKPILPMRAYALGVQSKYKSHSGEQEQGKKLFERAEKTDPYFSKATGAPTPDLFVPAGEISQRQRYLMRPF